MLLRHADEDIGRLIDFGLSQPCVRGVTLQPIQDAGRAAPLTRFVGPYVLRAEVAAATAQRLARF